MYNTSIRNNTRGDEVRMVRIIIIVMFLLRATTDSPNLNYSIRTEIQGNF